MYFHAMAITPVSAFWTKVFLLLHCASSFQKCTSLLVFGGVVKHEGRSNEIYCCRLQPASLEELALTALVDQFAKDSPEILYQRLKKLGVPASCLDWVKGIW